jgi:predicted DNA-binding transcriptional regulator AlpA
MPSDDLTLDAEVCSAKGVRALFGGKSHQWLYDQMRRDPKFPRPVQLSPYSVVWRVREIREYINALPRHQLSGLSGPDQRRAAAAQGGAA